MVNTHKIWENDRERIFRFSEYEEYFKGCTPKEIFFILKTDSLERFNGLKIIKDNYSSFFVTPSGEAFAFYGPVPNHDLESFESFKYLATPVYYDPSNGEFDFWTAYLEEIFKPKWKESSGPITSVAVGKTDFYERYGWWPYLETTNPNLGFMPMSHVADVFIEGEIVSIFEDLDYSLMTREEMHGTRGIGSFSENETNPVIVFGDGSKTPSHIQKRKISDKLARRLAHEKDGYEQFSNKLVPAEALYEGLAGCQDDYTPPAPFNKVLYHIPAPWHGVDETMEKDRWRLNSGDSGSFLLTWDGNWNFNLFYQQT